jgi:hypothetical protein
MIKGFSEWVNEDDRDSIPMSDDELIEYINSQMTFYRGRIGRESLLILNQYIKKEEKLGQSSDLTERARDLMSAHLNLKHGILQTLSKILREIYLRDPRNSDPTIDK